MREHALVVEVEEAELTEVGADVGLICWATCRTCLDFDLHRLRAQGAVDSAFDELNRVGLRGQVAAPAAGVGTEADIPETLDSEVVGWPTGTGSSSWNSNGVAPRKSK